MSCIRRRSKKAMYQAIRNELMLEDRARQTMWRRIHNPNVFRLWLTRPLNACSIVALGIISVALGTASSACFAMLTDWSPLLTLLIAAPLFVAVTWGTFMMGMYALMRWTGYTDEPMRCRHCGYSLWGLQHRRCPECGKEY